MENKTDLTTKTTRTTKKPTRKQKAIRSLTGWLRKTSEILGDESACTCYYQLGEAAGDMWFAVAALADGGPMVKLARNCDDLQCDYDWDWNMPTRNADGEVLCAEYSLPKRGEGPWGRYRDVAESLLEDLKAIPEFMKGGE